MTLACLDLVYVCALSRLLVLFCPRDIPVQAFLSLVNLSQIQWVACAEAVEAVGKIRTVSKVVGKITWRQARPRATSLQNADPRINTVAEKSALFRCSPDPIQMPKTQSQEKMTNRSDMKASVNYSLQLVQGIS